MSGVARGGAGGSAQSPEPRSRTTNLRVCLDARLASGTSGGVEQVIIGLASGLSQLEDGNEEYVFLADEDSTEWIRPYLTGRCRLLLQPKTAERWGGIESRWKRRLGPLTL